MITLGLGLGYHIPPYIYIYTYNGGHFLGPTLTGMSHILGTVGDFRRGVSGVHAIVELYDKEKFGSSPPTGPAGGALKGTYPNPELVNIAMAPGGANPVATHPGAICLGAGATSVLGTSVSLNTVNAVAGGAKPVTHSLGIIINGQLYHLLLNQ